MNNKEKGYLDVSLTTYQILTSLDKIRSNIATLTAKLACLLENERKDIEYQNKLKEALDGAYQHELSLLHGLSQRKDADGIVQTEKK